MACIGVGVDIVGVDKFSKIIEKRRSRFLDRIFTPGERRRCEQENSPIEAYSACFAAKEAFLKALGRGLRSGISWRELEVDNCRPGNPELIITGAARETAEGRGAKNYFLTMSHTACCAMAVVLLED
jgi:holo-[acyl-carrier protein] synthase